MTIDHDLAPDLERALAHLPSVPATSYLTAARKVRRRHRLAAGTVAVAVLAGGVAFGTTLGDSAERTLVASPGPSLDGGGHQTPVTGPGLEGIDAFTTETVPGWAQEYGSNGPVHIARDGRLWIAPGATVLRSVIDPVGSPEPGQPPESYGIEATYKGETRWVLLPYTMDDPGRWTNDFELWVDNESSQFENRQSVAERLVHFVGPNSETLAAGNAVELVRQITGADLSAIYPQVPRSSVAEVRWRGKTWFTVAQGPAHDPTWYEAYDQSIVGADDLEGFLAWLDARA